MERSAPGNRLTSMTPQFATGHITATPEAIELIEELKELHGPVAFFHPGGDCEGTEPVCLTRAELLPNPDDIRIGEVAGAPVYVDDRQYERWGGPELVIDVAEGPASGLPLGGLDRRHFVTRASDKARGPRSLFDLGQLSHR
jgi:uncharacterized protein